MSQERIQATEERTGVDHDIAGAPLPLEALVRLLDSEIAAVELNEQGPDDAEISTPELIIRFSVGEIVFAVTADQMVEIESVPALTFVPQAAPAVCGLANLRGEIIVVLDLARHFDQDGPSIGDSTSRRMIVVRNACLGRPSGVLVDRVFGIGPLDRDQLSPPRQVWASPDQTGAVLPKSLAPFVTGSLTVAEQDVALIDLGAYARSTEAET